MKNTSVYYYYYLVLTLCTKKFKHFTFQTIMSMFAILNVATVIVSCVHSNSWDLFFVFFCFVFITTRHFLKTITASFVTKALF